jgi:hypothetical protein
MSGLHHGYPTSRYSEDCWESAEAASAQLRREVAAARAEIAKRDAANRKKTRGQPRIEWTNAMIAALIDLRARGENLSECARVIGIAHTVCRRMARDLGLAKSMSRGSKSGTRIVAEARHGR